MDTNNGIDVVVVPPVVDETPVVKPAARVRRTPTTAPAPRRLRTMADAIVAARHVTPANVDAMIARFNANHGVTLAARNVGRLSGGRIMDVQNDFMADNRGLNDLQIAFVWRVDFPAAVGRVFTADVPTGVQIVRGVRAEYNRNGHGSKSDAWKTTKSVSTGPARFDWPKPAATKSA